jgi:hypothetical protein
VKGNMIQQSNNYRMAASRGDILISELCDEIDELRDALIEARNDAKYWRTKHAETVESDIKNGEKMIGQMLMLVLTKDIIPKSNMPNEH